MTSDASGREPCFHCGENALLDARLCPSCRSSLLVDLTVAPAVSDGRTRYKASQALRKLGPPMRPLLELQQALGSESSPLVGGVTRAYAQRVAATLEPLGVSIATTASLPAEAVTAAASPKSASTNYVQRGAVVGILVAFGLFALRQWQEKVVPKPTPAAARPAKRTTAAPLSGRELAQAALDAVVSLRCEDSVGSGFFVRPDVVMTNEHVLCPVGQVIKVEARDGSEYFGNPIESSERLDLALVHVVGADVGPLPVGDAGSLKVGDEIVVAGSPKGVDFTVHRGIVSNLEQVVFGVVSLKMADASGIGWALPINYAYADVSWIDAPAGAADSAGWLALLAGAGATNAEMASEFADIQFKTALVGADQDKYGRLVLRVAKLTDSAPLREDVTVNFWKGEEQVCRLKARVEGWKVMRSEDQPDPQAMRAQIWLKSIGVAARGWVGQAPIRWQVCPRAKMQNTRVEIELVGADPKASRVTIRVGRY